MLADFGMPYTGIFGKRVGIVLFVKRLVMDSMCGTRASLKAMARNAMMIEIRVK